MKQNEKSDDAAAKLVKDHRRQWRDFKFVYPVVSRRANGVSIGVNLNIDKSCTFSCMYCQVNRRIRREAYKVDVAKLRQELDTTLAAIASGEFWEDERFSQTPENLRRVNDIALSGDGESTCVENFDQAVATAAQAIKAAGLKGEVKIIIITNSTNLQAPQVRESLSIIDDFGGKFWCKLDAGTEEYFKKVNRPRPGITLEKVCQNILSVALGRPVVLQTLWFTIDSQPPSDEEIAAYIKRLRWLIGCEGQIDHIQMHTIARSPADSKADSLENDKLDEIANKVRAELPDLDIRTYYGQHVEPQKE